MTSTSVSWTVLLPGRMPAGQQSVAGEGADSNTLVKIVYGDFF